MRAVVFDLDGVIVDTAKYHYLGWKRLADHVGVPFDEEKNEKLKGVSRRESLIAMLGYTPDEDQIRSWCDLKNGFYVELIQGITRSDMLPGALDLIREIHGAAGWKQGLASASKNAPFVLKKLEIDHYFDVVVDGSQFERSKPHPEVFQKAAKGLGLSPERVVVVEDAEAGVQAGNAGGMRTIGIGRPDILHEANRVIRDLSEITLAGIAELFTSAPALAQGARA